MRLWLYGIAALLFDWVLYVVWTVIPLHAKDLGASPVDLGLLQAVSAALYVGMSILIGRAADRVSRPMLARIGCFLMLAGCVLIPFTGSVGALLAVVPIVGISGTFFWPSLQGALAAEAAPGRLEHDLGLFNVLWSSGKAAGFVTGALMKGTIGVREALVVAAAGVVAIALFYPRSDVRRAGDRPPDAADPRRRGAFLRMSWVMNFVAFGVGATLASQYILFCRDRNLRLAFAGDPVEMFFGVFLFACFASQTLFFVAMRSWRGWTYRRAPLYVAQLAMAAGCLALAHAPGTLVPMAVAPLIGIGLGFGYAASIYYSLHSTERPGRFAGLHEAILGSGNFLLPLAAGLLAGGLGDLRWPYWLCTACAIGAIAVEEAIYRTSATRSEK
jgi:MFS family permease